MNVPLKVVTNKQKKQKKIYIFFVDVLKVTDEKTRIRSQISLSEVRICNPDPDQYGTKMSLIRNTEF